MAIPEKERKIDAHEEPDTGKLCCGKAASHAVAAAHHQLVFDDHSGAGSSQQSCEPQE